MIPPVITTPKNSNKKKPGKMDARADLYNYYYYYQNLLER